MNMRPIVGIEELKKIQLGILSEVHRFCKENNIAYWLTAGTLLGAVRHKGFIPWDDDIDIGMTRPNYDMFRQLFNSKQEGCYRFCCPEDDKDYSYQMGKVFDTRTILYEPNKKYGYKISVYIDVFVYDNLPDDDTQISRLYQKRDRLKHIRTLQKAREHKGGKVRSACLDLLRVGLQIIPGHLLAYRIATNGKQYRGAGAEYYGDLVGAYRVKIDRKIVDTLSELAFEGKMYCVPSDYDRWLSIFFGDYMKLPPAEKRVSEHTFEAYYIEGD